MQDDISLVETSTSCRAIVCIVCPDSNGTLVIGSSSVPATGRTMNHLYSELGRAVAKRANRFAHGVGLGPRATADKIQRFFGSGEQRCLRLRELRLQPAVKLEKYCGRIMQYALPDEAMSTQMIAFKTIVALATRFPGVRSFFRSASYLRSRAPSEENILTMWDRPDEPPEPEWDFYRHFAAACLSDEDIAPMVEACPLHILSAPETGRGGLSIIERLLVVLDVHAPTAFQSSLSLRYLGGIVELPLFWHGTDSLHCDVARKLCRRMVLVLQDFGVDSQGKEDSPNQGFPDYEGVDLLAHAILSGLSLWSLDLLHNASWYEDFRRLVQMLCQKVSFPNILA
ncbi:hypothetical protein C8R44DRAFT_976045 [Mycena epipterygia]|nr:hypothetical protein C8R44DRAFT_976045 [Mycena epipterygia]